MSLFLCLHAEFTPPDCRNDYFFQTHDITHRRRQLYALYARAYSKFSKKKSRARDVLIDIKKIGQEALKSFGLNMLNNMLQGSMYTQGHESNLYNIIPFLSQLIPIKLYSQYLVTRLFTICHSLYVSN